MSAPPPYPSGGGRKAARLLLPALTALLSIGCGAVRSLELPWLADAAGAAWILYPAPADTRAHPAIQLEGVFRRSFEVNVPPPRALLRLRAFRSASVVLNDRAVPLPSPQAAWLEECRVDVGSFLRAGANELSVVVTNGSGPPALWVVLDLPGGSVKSDDRWEVSRAGAPWRPARRAAEPPSGARFDPDGRAERVLPSLVGLWPWLLGLFVLALAATIGTERWMEGGGGGLSGGADAPSLLCLVPGLLLAALLLNNAGHLPRLAGFDTEGHLEYIRYVQEERSVPFADMGWQMYQPPLYYVLSALLLRAGSWTVRQMSGVVAIRIFNLFLGLGNLALVFASLRLIFPGNARRQALGLAVASFLPALLLIYQFPTNEGLAITLSSAVFWASLRLLRARRPGLLGHALVGAALGGALLAKFSSVLLVPSLFGSFLGRLRSAPPADRRRLVAGIGTIAATTLLLCGWHFVRVAARLGRPIVGNWDPESGFAWWQDPGFRTAGDYLRFGRSLVSPQFSGLQGVWDGFYSTLWGDGLCGGVADLLSRPPWAHDLVAAGFALALVPVLGLAVGAVQAIAIWARRPGAVPGLLTGAALVSFAALLYMTLRIPSYAQAKSFYGLVSLVPLAALAAIGLDHLAGAGGWRRRLVFAGLALWAAIAYAAYWVPGGATRTRVALGTGLISDGDPGRAAQAYQAALLADPGSWDARLALAGLWVPGGAPRDVVEKLLQPSSEDPPIARRRLLWALFLFRQGESGEALREIDRGVRINPDLVELHLLRGAVLEAGGDAAGAAAARREALRIDPFDAANHQALERLATLLGDSEGAARSREYARRLSPAP